MSNKSLRTLVALCGAALLTVLVTGLAAAQATYVRSEPVANTTLAAPPGRVVIYFSEALDPTGNTITVIDPLGRTVSQEYSTISPTDSKVLQVNVRTELGSGKYTVNWTNKSTSGQVAQGTYNFNVVQFPNQLPTTGGTPLILLSALWAALGVGLTSLGWTLRGRKHREEC